MIARVYASRPKCGAGRIFFAREKSFIESALAARTLPVVFLNRRNKKSIKIARGEFTPTKPEDLAKSAESAEKGEASSATGNPGAGAIAPLPEGA